MPESLERSFLACMGRIFLETLSDYHKHGYDLEILCRACGHKVIMTPSAFFAGGFAGSPEKLERRLKCTRCKGRHAVISPTSTGPSRGERRGRSWLDR